MENIAFNINFNCTHFYCLTFRPNIFMGFLVECINKIKNFFKYEAKLGPSLPPNLVIHVDLALMPGIFMIGLFRDVYYKRNINAYCNSVVVLPFFVVISCKDTVFCYTKSKHFRLFSI